MTSFIRRFPAIKEGLTRFVKPESPCYDDNGNRLFPFIYNNGTLDITYSGNNFKSIMVDNTGNSPNNETETVVRIVGAARVVTSIGENFKAYIRAWRNGTIDVNSPISVYEPSQVVRVQEAGTDNIRADSGDSYIVSTSAPVSDNFISGMEDNNYNSTYIFKTPLTITIKEGGVLTYLTFRTIMDQE